MPRSLRFRRLISRKGTELGHMLILNTNSKSYMGSTISPSRLILSDLERSKLKWWKLSKLEIWMVRYCVRVIPRFQLFYSAAVSWYKSAENCHFSYQLQLSSTATQRQTSWFSWERDDVVPVSLLSPKTSDRASWGCLKFFLLEPLNAAVILDQLVWLQKCTGILAFLCAGYRQPAVRFQLGL